MESFPSRSLLLGMLLLLAVRPAPAADIPLQVYGAGDLGYGVRAAWSKGASPPAESHIHLGCQLKIFIVNFDDWLNAFGNLPDALKQKPPQSLIAAILPRLRLVLDGHVLQTISAQGFYFDDSAEKASYTTIYFALERASSSPESRADWQPVLELPGATPRIAVNIALIPDGPGIAKAPPSWVRPEETGAGRVVYFERIRFDGWFWTGVILFALAAVIFVRMAMHTTLLRDAGPAPQGRILQPFRLGRTKLEFLFFLI
jgi:hypothetical protein